MTKKYFEFINFQRFITLIQNNNFLKAKKIYTSNRKKIYNLSSLKYEI